MFSQERWRAPMFSPIRFLTSLFDLALRQRTCVRALVDEDDAIVCVPVSEVFGFFSSVRPNSSYGVYEVDIYVVARDVLHIPFCFR